MSYPGRVGRPGSIRPALGIQDTWTACLKDGNYAFNREGLSGVLVHKGIRDNLAEHIDTAILIVLKGLQA